MADEDSAREAGITSARRVYDRQVATLENIDDKAMRTVRTAVLILGFVAAALSTAGPSSVSSLSLTAVILFVGGVLSVAGAAFLGVGIYTVTEYPFEIDRAVIRQAEHVSVDVWETHQLDRLETAISEVTAEVRQNASYLEVAQSLLVGGTFTLLFATGATIGAHSYNIPARWSTGTVLGVIGLVWVVARVKRYAT